MLTRKSWYEVQNRCFEWGRVVARVDVRMRKDRPRHLDNGTTRSGEFVERFVASSVAPACQTSVRGETHPDGRVPGTTQAGRGSKKRTATTAAVIVALLSALSGDVLAACDSSDRIPANHANCLEASWDNTSGIAAVTPLGEYWDQGLCHEFGKVVAKVDVRSAMDRTLHLTDSRERNDVINGHIRQIYCCADMSVFCSH